MASLAGPFVGEPLSGVDGASEVTPRSMDPLHDPRCLVTTEALFLDGANGVCGTPRHHAGEAPPALGLVLFVGVMAVALAVGRGARRLLPRQRRALGVVAVGALVACSAPGLYALGAVRADSPTSAATSAHGVARAHDQVRAFATAHGGAVLRTETETSVVPIARLALTDVPGPGASPIDLFDGTLEEGCRDLGDTLACGSAPAAP